MAVRHDFLSRAFVFDVAENSVHFSLSPSLCDDDIKKIWAFTVINSNAEMRELERVAGAAGGTRLSSWGGGLISSFVSQPQQHLLTARHLFASKLEPFIDYSLV